MKYILAILVFFLSVSSHAQTYSKASNIVGRKGMTSTTTASITDVTIYTCPALRKCLFQLYYGEADSSITWTDRPYLRSSGGFGTSRDVNLYTANLSVAGPAIGYYDTLVYTTGSSLQYRTVDGMIRLSPGDKINSNLTRSANNGSGFYWTYYVTEEWTP